MAATPRQHSRHVTAAAVLEFLRLLWAVDHQLQRASKRLTRALGVTGPQRLAVRTIGTKPGLSPQDVAAALHLHKSTVTGILRRLEDQGLITRAVDTRDKRRARLHLTSPGWRISNAKGPTIERAVQGALSRVPGKSVDAARDVLSAIAQQLEEGAEPFTPGGHRRRRNPARPSGSAGVP